MVTPQGLSQSVGAERPTRLNRESGQHHPVPPAQADLASVQTDRPEHGDTHISSVCPSSLPVKGPDTAAIPPRYLQATRPEPLHGTTEARST